MPTLTFSIGGEEHDITGKSSKEVVDMIKKEYNKKKEEKVEQQKNKEEVEEEEEDDEWTIQYRKEMEEGCPEGYKTIWNNYGFSYEKMEEVEEELPSPPIIEDWFRTNAECVCEKNQDNDYPCLCDEV